MSQSPPAGSDALLRGSACDMCRKRRRRCDAKQPVCGPCVRKNQTQLCSYQDVRYPSAKLLKQRIEVLEEQIKAVATDSQSKVPDRDGNQAVQSKRLAKNPSPLDVPTSLRDPWVQFMRQEYIPSNIRDHFIKIWLVSPCGVVNIFSVDRFRECYRLPPSHWNSPHPAFLDAISLLACKFGGNSLRRFEPLFYQRLQKSLYRSLSTADRLHDFLRASLELVRYLCVRCRPVEAQHHMAATARFAMACGLHQIDTLNVDIYNQKSHIIGPVRDSIELKERIHTFWEIFCQDSIIMTTMGTPPTIPHDVKIVKTIWPTSFDNDSHDGVVASNMNIGTLFKPLLVSGPGYDTFDNAQAYYAKTFALYQRAVCLAMKYEEGSRIHKQEVVHAIHVTTQISAAIASYRQKALKDLDSPMTIGHYARLTVSLCMAHLSTIQLLHVFAREDVDCYWRRLEVARTIVSITEGISSTSSQHVFLWLPWCSSYEVIAWEVLRLGRVGDNHKASVARRELDVLFEALWRYPPSFATTVESQSLDQLKRFNIHNEEIDRRRSRNVQ